MPTRRLGSAAAVIACVAAPALAGCGGGGGGNAANTHKYVVEAPANNRLAAGIYVTIVSPLPIPTKLLTNAGGKLVSEAKGPQECSYTKTVQGSHGPGSFLSGQAITVKVNGSNPFTALACKSLKKAQLKASNLGGS